ncbi:MAG: SDR family NAD(P)-dependent oxidoreductase [Alistipes sp.]|nr:SDR family NAD(P)-dependent oxidoreductase [Alistipes sp.]
MKHPLRSVIIIGATSGIGRAVTERLVAEGARVGIAGRREDRLKEIQEQLGAERVSYRVMDVTKASATVALDELIAEVGAPDALLYASGIGKQNPTLDADIELRTVETNCVGMVRLVDHFVNYVKRTPAYNKKHKAHIAVITSVAGTMGMGPAPAYSATKSMQSTYLVALAQHARMEHIAISVGDIRPGFVATDILNPEKRYPMLMSVERAARFVVRSLRRHQRITIFDWRYRLLVGFWRCIPRCVWERLTMIRN